MLLLLRLPAPTPTLLPIAAIRGDLRAALAAVGLIPILDGSHVARVAVRAELDRLVGVELGEQGGLAEAGLVDARGGLRGAAGGHTAGLALLEDRALFRAGGEVAGDELLGEGEGSEGGEEGEELVEADHGWETNGMTRCRWCGGLEM